MVEDHLSLRHTPGGVPVIIERLPGFRSVALSVNVRVGSRDEQADLCGMAHLLEHVMFKGTQDQSAKEIADMIEGAGGEMNGFTTKEMTSYHVFSLDETISVAERILSNMMRHALIDEEHVQVEKGVVTQEINSLEEDPESYARVLLDQSIWKGHPMSYSESGELDCVERIGAENLREFHDRFYVKPNVYVVAVGNLQERSVMDWVSKNFDDLPDARSPIKRKAPRTHSTITVFPKEGDQAYVELGFPSYDAKHPQHRAASLAAIILGAGTSSRLYQRIREQEGLVYQIYMFPEAYSDCGLLDTYFSSSVGEAEKVVRLIAEELRLFKEEGLLEGEMERAKRWVKGMFVRKLESTENRMYWLGENYLLSGKVQPIPHWMEEFERVTEDQVLAAAQNLFKTRKLCIALHTPEKQGKKIARDLSSLDF
jgi:predicted Zn-dependent peptidase